MQPITCHNMLVTANTFENACAQVEEFFASTMLVQYDKIDIDREKSHFSEDERFSQILHENIAVNRKTLSKFITELEKTGFKSIKDLHTVECGYPSKLLHIITHFLDGFIGIDSTFYNLHEDSHWVSDTIQQEITEKALPYWIIHLQCYSETPEKVSLVQT